MKQILIVFSLLFFQQYCLSQSVITSSSNRIKNSKGEIDYTIGQLVYQSFNSSSVSVSQGIHNPIKIKPQGLSNNNSKLDLVIYPNPTRSLISIKCNLPSEFMYEIHDLNGRKITHGFFMTKTDINLETLSSGVYFLKVYSQENLSQNIFQIIKE